MIREQIARKLAESDHKDWDKMRNKDTWTCIEDYMSGKETYYEYADQVLSLLCAEIEKIPNPFPQLDPDLTRQNPSLKQNQMGFEDCRQAILNKLKEEK